MPNQSVLDTPNSLFQSNNQSEDWSQFPLVNASDTKLPDNLGYNQLGDKLGWDLDARWANKKDKESKQDHNMLTDAAPYPKSQGTQGFWGDSLLFQRMPTSGDRPWEKPDIPKPPAIQHMKNADKSIIHVPPYNDEESPEGAELAHPWNEDTENMKGPFYGNTET